MNVGIDYTMADIARICKGKWKQKTLPEYHLAYLSLDTRKISYPGETVFFAIKNRLGNANLFSQGAFEAGVRNFVTDEEELDTATYPGANIIVVKNTVAALQLLAVYHRNGFARARPEVIGITGSNGKTIVKEWLNQLLEKEFAIVRSPKSYNSQIGVPLSVLNLSKGSELALFEAGISTVGEMSRLEKMIRPDIGIITNIGHAHDEGFKSRRQKIREKLLLFTGAKHLIANVDDAMLRDEIAYFRLKHPQLQVFGWGHHKEFALQVKSLEKSDDICLISAVFRRKKVQIKIPFTDDASIQNAIHCWCVVLLLKKSSASVQKRFRQLYPIEMRLELKAGINSCDIINDSYSNDMYSLGIALDFLNQQKQHPLRTVILSDIVQSGINPVALYERVASLLQEKSVDKFIGIGPELFARQEAFLHLKSKRFFKSTSAFFDNLYLSSFHDETILIKGARVFGFEKISHILERKVHQTVLSINLTAIVHNLRQYRQLLKPSTKIMAMVKAFGYGSGAYEIASVLEYNRVDYLAVAYADEGIELRKAGIWLPIMVMNADASTFDALLNYNLEPEIFSFGLLEEFTRFLKKSETEHYPVHLKIDTGMHRLGFLESEVDRLCVALKGNRLLKVKTVFSHFAASEEPAQDDFTSEQFSTFNASCEKIFRTLKYRFDRHIDNTSGISRHPEFQLDMVRLGIGLYGIDSNRKMQQSLKNVSTLVTTVSQVKRISAGDTVGYGRSGKVLKDATIAVVGVGYADGYSRRLGNGVGKMMVNKTLVPTIGNICMDMTMLDISGIKDVKEGDEVIVFGESLDLPTIARWAGTIPYEIMTGISQRVKRIYFEE